MEYEVIYKIKVNAESPKQAALGVERILVDNIFRPWLTVISPDKTVTEIDLENEEDNE